MRQPEWRTCLHCGEEFYHSAEHGPLPKWCSPSCRQAANLERRMAEAYADGFEDGLKAQKEYG